MKNISILRAAPSSQGGTLISQILLLLSMIFFFSFHTQSVKSWVWLMNLEASKKLWSDWHLRSDLPQGWLFQRSESGLKKAERQHWLKLSFLGTRNREEPSGCVSHLPDLLLKPTLTEVSATVTLCMLSCVVSIVSSQVSIEMCPERWQTSLVLILQPVALHHCRRGHSNIMQLRDRVWSQKVEGGGVESDIWYSMSVSPQIKGCPNHSRLWWPESRRAAAASEYVGRQEEVAAAVSP